MTVYNKTKDILITSMRLTNGRKGDVDLTNMFIAMNIYEDIFLNYITADITLTDALGLIEAFPIIGDEKLHVKFKTSSEAEFDYYEKTFDLFKIQDVQSVSGQKTKVYTIQLVSDVMDRNMSKWLRLSYKQKREDEIIKSICENQLGVDVEVETTKYERSFVVPSWRPMYTINYLARTAVRNSAANSATFLFYEDKDKFNFKSLDYLMEQSPVMTLTNKLARVSKGSVFSSVNVESYNAEDTFNTLNQSTSGMYANKIITQDLINKKVEEYTYSYDDIFDSMPKIDLNAGKLRKEHDSNPDRMVQFWSSNYDNKNVDEWGTRRSAQIALWQNHVFTLDMQGNTNMLLGSVVEFDLPSSISTVEGPDKYLSGNYVVTRIRHTIDQSTHKMLIEVRKPSLKEEAV